MHRDFARVFRGCDPTAVRLAEVQLLTNRVREHTLDEDDVGEVEDMIAESAARMTLALDGRKHPELRPADFPVAGRPESCADCPFRRRMRRQRRGMKPPSRDEDGPQDDHGTM